MPDPEGKKLTEVDLELGQRRRLLEMFSRIETYDERESVITFCAKIIGDRKAD